MDNYNLSGAFDAEVQGRTGHQQGELRSLDKAFKERGRGILCNHRSVSLEEWGVSCLFVFKGGTSMIYAHGH